MRCSDQRSDQISRSVVSDPQRPHGLPPTRLFHPWDFPGKSTGVGCHCLLKIITFPKAEVIYSAIVDSLEGLGT